MSFNWFKRWENILALTLALIVLVLHLIIINQVDVLMFDENHYVTEAEAIIARDKLDNLEHPPLGKLIIAANLALFGDDTTLNHVWGTSNSDVFAVGTNGAIRHFNGASWGSMDSHTSADLFGVWGTSASDVYAVGENGTMRHYDGISWNSIDSNTSADLLDIWGSSASDIYAVGSNGAIQHFNGISWDPIVSNTEMDLFGIWGSSNSDVYAVGANGTIQHYNGTLWSSADSGTWQDLFGIWGSSSSNIYAVGASGEIQRYNGTKWYSTRGNRSEDLFGIWGNSPSNIIAVGSLGTILHYDGDTWDQTDDNTTGFPLNSVWSSSESNAFAVGRNGIIFEYSGSQWKRKETDPFDWRFFPVLFGVASIILFYLICQRLTDNKYVPLLATFVFAFENQGFVQSSVAMLDIFSFTFMLASFWLYLRGNYISSGGALALAALAKMSGIYGGAVILLYWFFTSGTARKAFKFVWGLLRRLFSRNLRSIPRKELQFIAAALSQLISKPMRDQLLSILKVGISTAICFLGLMYIFDWAAMGEWVFPWDRIEFMQDQISSLTFANTQHEARSYPWEWIISPNPQWFWYKPTYESSPTWTVWGLIIPSMVFALVGAIKRHRFLLFSFLWFVGTYFSWYLILHLTDRVMFKFYFYPTVGSICLAIGWALWALLKLTQQRDNNKMKWAIRIPVFTYLIAHVVIFVIMSPYCDWTSRY